MQDRERRLVEAAPAALRYFQNRLGGSGLNGPNDDLFIGRQLDRALADWTDIPDPRVMNEAIVTRFLSETRESER